MSQDEIAAPWWERLPQDFYLHDGGTEIDHRNPVRIFGSAALDRFVRSALGSLLSASFTPMAMSPGFMKEELRRSEFYRELADDGDVDRIFHCPPPVKVQSRQLSSLSYRPRRVVAEGLSFKTPFVPLHPELRERHKSWKRNQLAHAQYWTHADGPRPTLIFQHGFFLDEYSLNSRMFCMEWFYRQGYDILLPTLPFHGCRKERFDPFSGFGWVGHGLTNLNEAALQAVCETRVWIDYLLQRGAPSIGMSGLSLGGYITSIMPNVDERLAYAIPNSPVVTLLDMAMEWSPIGQAIRAAMRTYGFTLGEQRHASAAHSPLTFTPRISPERLMVIGGAGDRLTAPRFVRLLHEHWQGSQLLWFPGNHLIHFDQKSYLKQMLVFMNQNTKT